MNITCLHNHLFVQKEYYYKHYGNKLQILGSGKFVHTEHMKVALHNHSVLLSSSH